MGGIRRTAVRWCSACLVALGVVITVPLLAEESPLAPALTLNLILPEHRLSPLSTTVMKKELARIWMREGVEIVWRRSEQQVPPGEAFVHLTLIDDVDRPHRSQAKYVLGDFLSDESRIRISLFAATQAAMKGTVTARRSRDAFDRPRALGFILGRALAHEVGHALLGRAHAETGLMSATFDPATMADAHSERFRLSSAQSAQLSLARLSLRAAADVDAGPVSLEIDTAADALTR